MSYQISLTSLTFSISLLSLLVSFPSTDSEVSPELSVPGPSTQYGQESHNALINSACVRACVRACVCLCVCVNKLRLGGGEEGK